VRRDLGVGPDEILVGGVGRLVREKGIAEFVAAAHRLAGRATFVWVGPADTDKADAFVAPPGNVRFLGERADVEAFYNALDVFVLPSYREGFSRSAMEAAACETAMVLSDIRGCREIGEHGSEVLFVPPRDVGALVHTLDQVVVDPVLRRRLGRAAGARARASFDQRKVALASLQTYAAVARRKSLGWQTEGMV
jgi:glycosyltransferase involved in cell wall biosynthesis